MHFKPDEKKAGAILCHLEGAAFDYYFDTYSHIGSLTEAASNGHVVKSDLSDRLTETPRPEENIQKPMSCRLDGGNLLASMDEMDRLYRRAIFNNEAVTLAPQCRNSSFARFSVRDISFSDDVRRADEDREVLCCRP